MSEFQTNTYFRTTHPETLKPEWDKLIQWGYNINYDHFWKWASIWKMERELHLAGDRIYLDVGGGSSALQHIFSHSAFVYNIDRRPRFFEKRVKGITIPSVEARIKLIRNNFSIVTTELEKDSVDFAYDSCSLTHFPDVKRSIRSMFSVLKPGGFFAAATDVLHPLGLPVMGVVKKNRYKNDVYSVEAMSGMFTAAGLEFVNKPDWVLEPFFLDEKNVHMGIPKSKACTERCKGLPEYHRMWLCPSPHGRPAILRATFLLRKPT